MVLYWPTHPPFELAMTHLFRKWAHIFNFHAAHINHVLLNMSKIIQIYDEADGILFVFGLQIILKTYDFTWFIVDFSNIYIIINVCKKCTMYFHGIVKKEEIHYQLCQLFSL